MLAATVTASSCGVAKFVYAYKTWQCSHPPTYQFSQINVQEKILGQQELPQF